MTKKIIRLSKSAISRIETPKLMKMATRGKTPEGVELSDTEIEMVMADLKTRERCNECGQSVAMGSGNFVNRIPDLNTVAQRKEMGKPYPQGEWMCAKCYVKISCPACPKCKEPIERLEVEQTHRVRGELQPDGFIENEMGRPEDIETEVYRCPACNYVISYEYEEACAFMSKEWDGVHRPVKNEVKP